MRSRTVKMPSHRDPTSTSHLSGWFALAVGLSLFFLNAFLLTSSLGWQDSGEFLATTACLGISHPSGQPLYHLLGKCFLAIPFGSPAWRLGLLSVVAATAAVILLMSLVRRTTSLPLSWTLPLCLAWAWTWPWWNQALTVETYSLGILLAVAVLWSLTQREPRRTMLTGLFLGLSCVYRPTYILGLFIAIPYLVRSWPEGTRLRRTGRFIAFWGIGISLPIYLAVRSGALAPVMFSDLSHGIALAKHVLGLSYSQHLGASTTGGVLSMAGQFIRLAWDGLTPVGSVLALLGVGWVLNHWKHLSTALKVGCLWALLDLGLVLTVPYPVLESHQVLWPWVFSALLAACGLRWLWDRVDGTALGRWAPAMLALFALLQLANLAPILEKRSNRSAEDYARDVLSVMPKGALYHASCDNDYFPVIGMQQGYGFRKDVTVVSPGDLKPGEEENLVRRVREGAPVVVARLAPGLFPGLVANPLGPFWLYGREPACVVAPYQTTAPLAAWGSWELVDFGSEHPTADRGGLLKLRYLWHKRQGALPAEKLQTLVLLVDEKGDYPLAPGGGWWLHDTHVCLNGWYPLKGLDARKTYAYERILFIPSGFPAGRYRVVVALQDAALPQEGKRVAGGEFYGDGAWQADWQVGSHGTYGAVERMTSGTGEEKRLPLTGGTAPRVFGRFAVVGEVEIR